MQAESVIKKQLAIEKQELIPVFQRELPGVNVANPIDAFKNLLANKPDGYWLIRESRVDGMISVTFKINKDIKHGRFVFANDHWTMVGNNDLNNYIEGVLPFEALTRDTVGTKINLLFDAIFSSLPLVFEKMVIPSEAQATHNLDYVMISPYILMEERDGKEKKIYANLLGSLNHLEGIMTNLEDSLDKEQQINEINMDTLSEIKLPVKELLMEQLKQAQPFKTEGYAKQIKELFANWLTANALTLDLYCPVSLDLYEEPYYVVESGHVFDASSLFPNGNDCLNACPLTREVIESHPVHFAGYRRELNERLLQFFDIIQLHQQKTGLNKSTVIMPKASDLPFFSTVKDDGSISIAEEECHSDEAAQLLTEQSFSCGN